MRLRHSRVTVLLLFFVALFVGSAVAEMRIQSLTVAAIESDSLLIDSELEIELSESIQDAIDNGVGIQIVFEVQLLESKQNWPDRHLGELRYLFEIKYHALSEQYIVTSFSPADRNAFPDLYSALYDKRELSSLHLILFEPASIAPSSYLRAKLRVNTESLPLPLRIKSYFDKDWRASSGWTSWRL